MENKKIERVFDSTKVTSHRFGIEKDISNEMRDVKEYIEQLEEALDKACEQLETFDTTFNNADYADVKNRNEWKEWCMKHE